MTSNQYNITNLSHNFYSIAPLQDKESLGKQRNILLRLKTECEIAIMELSKTKHKPAKPPTGKIKVPSFYCANYTGINGFSAVVNFPAPENKMAISNCELIRNGFINATFPTDLQITLSSLIKFNEVIHPPLS